MAVIAQETFRRARRHPVRVPIRSNVRDGVSISSAHVAALALCAALAAAAAMTAASFPRSASEAVTATGRFLPVAVTIDRRLKGDRLDRMNLQSSSMPDEPLSPGNIVPKTSPATPDDPAHAPQDDLIEHGCAPIPGTTHEPSGVSELKTLMQCVASAERTKLSRHSH